MACHTNTGHQVQPLLKLPVAIPKPAPQRSGQIAEPPLVDADGGNDIGGRQYDNGASGTASSSFEFHKGDSKSNMSTANYLKPAPSKWDDAQKWLLSHHASVATDALTCKFKAKGGPACAKHPTSHGSEHGFAFLAPAQSSPPRAKSSDSFNFPCVDEPDVKKEVSVYENGNVEALLRPAPPPRMTEKPISDPASFVSSATALRSISMRDMGTEMTPIASQEPSQTGTPVQATTPTMRSPGSSPSTPRRATPASSPIQGSANIAVEGGDATRACNLGELALQKSPRREEQLENLEIDPVWAAKEDEDSVASKLLRSMDLDEVKKNVLETRAAAWEEAEQAKYTARFKREEAKIQAWENHAKAKAEAEMRRAEVKVEKKRSRAHERFMNKLAAAKRRAEELRAAAKAKRREQAAKAAEEANRIRQTGRSPTPFFRCGFCS